MNIKKITIEELKDLRHESKVAMLYQQQDLACNLDYILYPIESDIVQSNINLLEQVLIYKEL